MAVRDWSFLMSASVRISSSGWIREVLRGEEEEFDLRSFRKADSEMEGVEVAGLRDAQGYPPGELVICLMYEKVP